MREAGEMIVKKAVAALAGLALMTMAARIGAADQMVIARKTGTPPIIDGNGSDAAWRSIPPISTRDRIGDIDIKMRAAYTDQRIYFLVRFSDPDESRAHKDWVWDKENAIYRVGSNMEDTFVFKWSMESTPFDLRLRSDRPHRADIWFWKACRTDPAGYADDKMQIVSSTQLRGATEVVTRSGRKVYLLRLEDEGKGAYKTNFQTEYGGETLPRYEYQAPSGSRADVEAKGLWRDGLWTIELSRLLHTGNEDDVQLDPARQYIFGVSRYEIAGRERNNEISQPAYGSGDISELLTLSFGGLQ